MGPLQKDTGYDLHAASNTGLLTIQTDFKILSNNLDVETLMLGRVITFGKTLSALFDIAQQG